MEPAKPFWKENASVLIALAVVGLLPFLTTILTGRVLFASDQVEAYAWRFYFQDMPFGVLPVLWNPFGLAGMPTLDAIPGDGAYPPVIWFFGKVFPATHWVTYSFIFHVLVAGFSAFLLVRRFFGLERVLALGVAAAYMLNTNFISHIHAGHTGKFYIMAWLPLSLYFLLRTLGPAPRWRHPVLLAASVALLISTGHLQLTYYVLMGYFLYFAFKAGVALKAKDWKGAASLTGRFWIPVLLGVGLAFPVFYPPTQYNKLFSVRGEVFNQRAGQAEGEPNRQSYEHATSWSIHPEETASLVVPEFAGLNENYWGRNMFKLNSEYPGLAILFLGVFGLAALRRKWFWFWGAVGLAAIVYGLGANTPLFRLVYAFIPGVKSFRAPSMMLFWLAMALTMMSAYLLAILSGGFGGVTAERRARMARGLLKWGFGSAAALALLGIGSAVTYGFWDAVFDPQQIQNFARRQANAGAFAFGAVKNAVLLAVLVEALRRWLLDASKGMQFGLVLLAVACADLYVTNSRFIQPVEASRFLSRDPAVEALKADPSLGRVLNLPGSPKRTFLQYHEIESLGGWADNEYGLYREFRGFDYQRNPNFMEGLQQDPSDGSVHGNVFLDLLNATHLTFAVQEVPGTQVARNRSALPRAWFVTRWEAKDADSVIALLKAPGFDPRSLAYVSGAASLPGSPAAEGAAPGEAATVTAVSRHHTRHVYKVDAKQAGLLVFSEPWFPMWKAYVDGKEAESLRVDFLLRGVHLGPGSHEVVYSYESAWIRMSLLVMALAALALAVLGFVFHRAYRSAPRGAAA